MSIFDPILSFFHKQESSNSNPTKSPPRRPIQRNTTDSLTVNQGLTKGLYFGDYAGLKLASALAMAPVKIPVFFMGFPMPKVDEEDEELEGIIKSMLERWTTLIQSTHLQKRRDGTIWLFPKYNSKSGQVDIEIIPDNTISDIVRDLDTGEIIRIYTDEEIKLSTGYDETATVRRQRVYTRQRVEVRYIPIDGVLPSGIKDKSMRNMSGTLPVHFSHESDADEIRGHSIYGRIISDLKNYADIDQAQVEMLAKFKTKLSSAIDNVDQFAKDNGFPDGANDEFFNNFDLTETDMIFYRKGKEGKPELLELNRTVGVYSEALKRVFWKIIQGTGIPEIAWGLKSEGNMASVEENMGVLLMYVRGDQRECTDPWQQVFTAALRLELGARMIQRDFNLTVTWDDLDAISDKTKSEIFRNFAEGISKTVDKAALTEEQLFKLWKMNFPKATEDDFEEFKKGLTSMATHKGYSSANYMDQLAAGGVSLEDME